MRPFFLSESGDWRLVTGIGERPVVDLDFANSRYWFQGNFRNHSALLTAIGGTHTRADATTCATYFDSAGVLQTAAANVLRFDHNPSTLAPLGILLEGAGTNVFLHSEDITNASGVNKLSTTETANAGTAPDGNTTADRLVGTNGDWYWSRSRTLTVATYTISAWVKSNTGASQTFRLFGDSLPLSSDLTATTSWQRFTFSFTGAASSKSHGIARDSSNNDADLLVWGLQLELGAFASSYMKTTTANVTRAADSLVIGPTGGVPFTGFSATAGSLIVAGQLGRVPAAAAGLVSLHDNTANEVIELVADASANLDFDVVDGGVSQAAIDSTVNVAANTAFKLGAAWAAADFAASADGTAAQTDAAGTLPIVDRMGIGTDQAGNALFGHISRLTYFPSRISNADLVRLST